MPLAGDPLAGLDAGDFVIGQRDDCQTFVVQYYPVFRESEIHIVKAIFLAVGGQVVGVRGVDVQEKSCRSIVCGAGLLEVCQRIAGLV